MSRCSGTCPTRYARSPGPTRGHGDSSSPADGYRIADLAADVVALLDALEIERAVIVGHSMSTWVAEQIAIDHPERVLGLVLEGAFGPP